MHRATVAISALLLASSLLASEAAATWVPEGIQVSSRTSNTYVFEKVEIGDGIGGIIVVWIAVGGTHPEIHAQKVDRNGKPRWDSLVVVTAAPGQKNLPRAVSDGAGGAIIVWADGRNRGAPFDLYARRVNAAGTVQWAADVSVDTSGFQVRGFNLASDGAGGAIVAWMDDRNGNRDVFARRISSAGVASWTTNGVPICMLAGEQNFLAIAADGAGGAVMAWWDRRNGTAAPWVLAAQRVNAGGTPLWTSNGVVVPDSTYYGLGQFEPPAIVGMEASQVILAWVGLDRTQGQLSIYGQRLASADGARMWLPGGSILLSGEGLRTPKMVPDAAHGVIIATADVRTDVLLRAQRAGPSGLTEWGINGVDVVSLRNSGAYEWGLAADSIGGAVLTWSTDPSGPLMTGTKIFAQRVDSTGALRWAAEGAGVRVGPGSNWLAGVVSDDAGGGIVSWLGQGKGATAPARAYVRRVTSAGLGRVDIQSTTGGVVEFLAAGVDTLTTVWVSELERASFRLRPNFGYYIDDVTVNGATIGVAPNPELGFDPASRTLQVNFANGTWFEPSLLTPAGSYTTVAFPVSFTNDSVRYVLGGLGDFDDTQWRMARWSPVAGEYQFAGDGLSRLRAGEGYWLITASGQSIQAQGRPLTADTAGVTFFGATGWQQIANPYRFPIADTALTVLANGTPYLFTDPSNTFTDRTIWEWGGGSEYDSVRTLLPRRAYWIRKSFPANVRLVFPNRSSTRPVPVPLTTPDGAEWALAARARQQDRASARVVLGGWSRGRAGPLRVEAPPDPPDGSLSLRLVDADGGRRVAEFRERAGPLEWTIELSGAVAPGEVAIEWTGDALPAGLKLWLVDPARGMSQEIRLGAKVTLAATQAARRITLRAAYGEGGPSPQPTTVGPAYPNPFHDRVGLTLQLARAEAARVVIFDLQGRRVRDLGERELAPGEHVLVWDGADDAGRPSAPGVYLARIELGGARESRRLLKLR